MLEILRKFDFLRSFFSTDQSARKAKERLRLVLIQDQCSISPGLLNVLRREMIGVVSRYLEIDSANLEMGLERRNETIALAANIPIVRIRKEVRVSYDDAVLSEVASPAPGSNGKKTEKRFRRGRKRVR